MPTIQSARVIRREPMREYTQVELDAMVSKKMRKYKRRTLAQIERETNDSLVICANGYAQMEAARVPFNGPVARHEPPVSPQLSQDVYILPTPTCGTSYRTCSCRTSGFRNYSQLVSDYKLGAILANEERTLNRRLLWSEAQFAVNSIINGVWRTGEGLMGPSGFNMPNGLLEALKDERNTRALADCMRSERRRLQSAIISRQRMRQANAEAREAKVMRILKRISTIATAPTAPGPLMTQEQIKAKLASLGLASRGRCSGYCEHECENEEGDRDPDCSCCTCEGVSALRKAPEHGVPFNARKGDASKRYVGVEVEYNRNVNLSPWVMRWNGAVHADGSCGWEAVTTPIAGRNIDECLADLCKHVRSAGSSADSRCGVHVHVDANDVTWSDMLRILAVYAKLEPLLYLIAGQQRLEGQYCAPCGPAYLNALAAKDVKDSVMSVAYRGAVGHGGRDFQRNRPGKKEGGRYKGINIIPWLVGRRDGKPDTTIEFRIHRNSLDGARLAQWAHLCSAIVDYACKATDAEVKALPASALRALCERIAPSAKSWVIRRVKEWRNATTVNKDGSTNAAGMPIALRRISVKKGVYSCAV